jgi:hypothetical protein
MFCDLQNSAERKTIDRMAEFAIRNGTKPHSAASYPAHQKRRDTWR